MLGLYGLFNYQIVRETIFIHNEFKSELQFPVRLIHSGESDSFNSSNNFGKRKIGW